MVESGDTIEVGGQKIRITYINPNFKELVSGGINLQKGGPSKMVIDKRSLDILEGSSCEDEQEQNSCEDEQEQNSRQSIKR